MARPGPDPALIERARQLADADDGTPLARVAAQLEEDGTPVPVRTLQRWLPGRPVGAPRLAAGEGSRTTRWRQQQRAESTGADPEQPASID